MWYNGSSPLLAFVGGVFGVSALSFVVIGEGFFLLRNGEAAGCGLLRVFEVQVCVTLFEGGAVESCCQNGCPADDVRSGDQLFRVLLGHGLLDAVLDCFGFLLCFADEVFEGFQLFDLGDDFGCAHGVSSFCVV